MLCDTSGFLCVYDESEPHHGIARQFYNSAQTILTTNYILAEYTALAHVRGIPRREIIEFSFSVLDNTGIEIVWIDKELHRKAVELIKNRPDKNYSICDAVSFVLMREREIGESLTTDKHFEQEGFVRLLK